MSAPRSRVAGILGAVVVLALVVGAAWFWWSRSADTSPAPATKKSIAALTVDVLDISPSSYDVNPYYDVPAPLGLEIRWHPDEGDSHRLLPVVEDLADADPSRLRCSRYYDCANWDSEVGKYRLSWQLELPESDPGILTLSLQTPEDEFRRITYSGESILGDPREQEDLPISIEEFAALLADPRFSATTTQDLVDADLAKWPEDEHAGDAVTTTGAEVAQWAFQDGVRRPTLGARPADLAGFGPDAVGVAFRSPDRVTTLIVLAKDDPHVPTCEVGWHCRTRRGVTTGWRDGEAIVIRESDYAAVVGSVRSVEIDGLPTPSWKHGRVGDDFYALEYGYANYSLQTTRAFAGSPPRWYRED